MPHAVKHLTSGTRRLFGVPPQVMLFYPALLDTIGTLDHTADGISPGFFGIVIKSSTIGSGVDDFSKTSKTKRLGEFVVWLDKRIREGEGGRGFRHLV